MSVLSNYVERLERSIGRNLAILTGEVEEFEAICRQAVERREAHLGRQARQWYQRALARFQEMEKVEQVLHGPRYRRLTEPAPHRESTILALRARYYQAFLPLERAQRWESSPAGRATTGPSAGEERRNEPFSTPEAGAAFASMVSHLGEGDALTFALVQGEPSHLDAIPPTPFAAHGIVERHGPRELRAALLHPESLAAATIEAIVYDRLLGRSPQGRAVLYRLHGPEELATPFLSALRLNLPRVAPGTVLTLNPAVLTVG